MHEKDPSPDRKALGQPSLQLGPIRMPGIEIEGPHVGSDLHLLTVDPNLGGAVLKDPSERSLRLEPDEENGRLVPPEPVLQVMPDATRLAHAAGRDDDVETVNAVDSLALLDGLREANPSGLERLHQGGAVPELPGMAFENCAGFRGQG